MAVQVYGTYIQFNDGTTQSTAAVSSAGSVKAWVNFVGSTAVINGSSGVTSVTRNSTGDYTINLSVNMGTANWAIAGAGRITSSGGSQYNMSNAVTQPLTATSGRILFYNNLSGGVDPTYVTSICVS